jgi:hypothetical protein
MKIGNNQEYLVHLGTPFDFWGTGPGAFIDYNATSTNFYVASMFIPKYNMSVNRIAFFCSASGTSVMSCGISSSNLALGIPLKTGNSINFLNFGTTQTTVTTDYTQVSFTNTVLKAGNVYFATLQNTARFTGNSIRTIAGGMSDILEFPYYVASQSTSNINAKFNGMTNICLGYNDGSFTQWYGYPCVVNRNTLLINNTSVVSASQTSYAGALISLPPIVNTYFVKGVTATMNKNGGAALLCRIFESDNVTQVTNATSFISTSMCTLTEGASATPRQFSFYFGGPVYLQPNKNYYVRFSGIGSTIASGSQSTLLYYALIQSSAISTSMSVGEFQNAYSTKNNLILGLGDGTLFVYQNARASITLECQSFVSSFRGTKENGYVGF